MRLEYTDKAVGDLVRLRRFIEEHDPQAATRIAARLVQGIALLRDQPQLGHLVALAPDPESIRDLVLRDYVVRYAITNSCILILRIWHHREYR
jgi:plasmid stabilization system protein ParE